MKLFTIAIAVPRKLEASVDFDPFQGHIIHMWEEHTGLQNWLERLYHARGGTSESFYYRTVQLDERDIDQLEALIMGDGMPHTTAAGGRHVIDWLRDEDLGFIRKARKATAEGKSVFCTSAPPRT